MTFFDAFCGNTVSLSMTTLFFVGAVIQLFGEIPYKNRKHYCRIFGSLILFIAFCAFAGTLFYKTGLFAVPHNGGEMIYAYIQITGVMLVLRVMYRKPFGVCLATSVFLAILYDVGWNLADILSPNKIYDLSLISDRREYLFNEWITTPLCLILVILLLYKTNARELFAQWEEQKPKLGVLVFLGFYPILSQIVQETVDLSAREVGYNPATAMIFLLVVYMIFMYTGREGVQQKRIEDQEVSLRQQRAYIENLEGLQREVRKFRHDFKNMMSGMYLQAEEGDLKAIQGYIHEMTEDFDLQVGSQIRLMNQLANIRVTEVKGLFLEKMKTMQVAEIHWELEVLKPFEKTRLRNTDLCRCLGILLDNAMEEVKGREDGQIHIMISSQSGYTTFRVKNTLYSAVDFHKVGTPGYSTKGKGRGIGLDNYKKILGKYEKTLPLTTIQDGYFIQELKIQEV
ncbi:MAG: GHKL domain-containing protein [Dorea sp.]|jgi:two-component system sensor histidine kinase AgrC|nr:GHKL domain-containing protein [Dorea sp.]